MFEEGQIPTSITKRNKPKVKKHHPKKVQKKSKSKTRFLIGPKKKTISHHAYSKVVVFDVEGQNEFFDPQFGFDYRIATDLPRSVAIL